MFYNSFRIPLIELGKYIVKEQYNRKIDVFSQKEYLDLFECEEEDLILSTREVEGTGCFCFHSFARDHTEVEIITVYADMCMSALDIVELIFRENYPDCLFEVS